MCVPSLILYKMYFDGCNGIKRKASAMSLLGMCTSSVHSCMSLIASDNRSYLPVDPDVSMLEFTE